MNIAITQSLLLIDFIVYELIDGKVDMNRKNKLRVPHESKSIINIRGIFCMIPILSYGIADFNNSTFQEMRMEPGPSHPVLLMMLHMENMNG